MDKSITINDNGLDKVFVINKMPAIPALLLVREVVSLMKDTQLIRGVMLQQKIHHLLQTGVEIEGVTEEDYRKLMGLDDETLIASFVNSILTNLDDAKTLEVIKKCLADVVYKNGTVDRPCHEAFLYGEVSDVTTLVVVIKEVLLFNFGGALAQLKKHLGSANKNEKS
jgi:hypothetical protein